MSITAIEAWTLARAIAGYPMTTDRHLLSASVLEMTRHVGTLRVYQDRQWWLSTRIDSADMQLISNSDTESPMPGTLHTSGTGQRSWKIIPASDLARLPKSSWLIPDILPQMGLSVLFGAPGSYKSFTALDWSLRISQAQPAVYVIYEGLTGYWQRIKAWAEHNVQGYGNLYITIGDLAIMDLNQLNEFIVELTTYKPALVVIDTLARSMTGADENSSRDMGLFVAACERIRREIECSVLIVHHTNKNGHTERGSIALRGAADMMARQYVDDDTIVLECEKMKDAEAFQPLYKQAVSRQVKIDGESYDVPVLIESSLVIRDGSKLTTNQRKILNVLAMEIFTGGAAASDIAESLPELGRGSINRALSNLIKAGLIEQPQKRDPYKLTTEGMTRLTHLTQPSGSESRREHASHVSQPSQSSQSSQTKQARLLDAPVKEAPGYYDN